MRSTFLLFFLTVMASPVSAQEHADHDAHSPYVADRARAIKALAPDEITGLLEGHGMGLARAAELNDYPGPLHVLELADELQLSEMQREEVERIRVEMQATAQTLGAQIVEMEQHLDALFAESQATIDALDRMTAHLAEMKGRLRAAHLGAHIGTRSTLTSEQVALYNRLRGYTTG